MLPVKTKLSTKVSTLPVSLQLTALTIGRESRTRTNISSSRCPLHAQCSRSRGGVDAEKLCPNDRAEMVKDDKVAVNCEFCSSVYEFTPQESEGAAQRQA